jgi:hypothetical protein
MSDNEVEKWCYDHNWTEPRLLELGIWVAFPPGGVIETPLPMQVQKPKAKSIENILDFVLLAIITTTLIAIAIIISPCFIEPIVNRRRNNS